jgi:hypothetical protein
MLQHRVEDGIIQGEFQKYAPGVASQYKGCLIGCTLPMGTVIDRVTCCDECSARDGNKRIVDVEWHEEVQRLYGIPIALNHLLDGLFESLPADKAAWFAVSTIEAIPVGGNLNVTMELFLADLKEDTEDRRSPRWLKSTMQIDLAAYEDEESDERYDARAVALAERLIGHLANAPVPGTKVQIPSIPAPHPETLNSDGPCINIGPGWNDQVQSLNFVPTPEEINV